MLAATAPVIMEVFITLRTLAQDRDPTVLRSPVADLLVTLTRQARPNARGQFLPRLGRRKSPGDADSTPLAGQEWERPRGAFALMAPWCRAPRALSPTGESTAYATVLD